MFVIEKNRGKILQGRVNIMSLESARAYVAKLKSDGEFRDKIGKAKREERSHLIKEAGFDFTPEEVNKVKGELSVDDLDKIGRAHV